MIGLVGLLHEQSRRSECAGRIAGNASCVVTDRLASAIGEPDLLVSAGDRRPGDPILNADARVQVLADGVSLLQRDDDMVGPFDAASCIPRRSRDADRRSAGARAMDVLVELGDQRTPERNPPLNALLTLELARVAEGDVLRDHGDEASGEDRGSETEQLEQLLGHFSAEHSH